MKTETVFLPTGEIEIHRNKDGKAIGYQPVSYVNSVRVLGELIYRK